MSKLGKTDLDQQIRNTDSIRLSQQDAQDLKRLLRLLTPVEMRRADWVPDRPQATEPFHTTELLHVARAIVISRQTRKAMFASSIFGEPAWDMLLALYIAEEESARITVSRLAQLSDARLTTAIRWIEYLDQSGLVRRGQHPHDARVVLIELTEQARERLEAYFRTLIDAGYVA